MNHPRDVRAGRVPGRLGCIFSLHVLEFDCFLGEGGEEAFRSERLALATLGAPLPAPQCNVCRENTGLRQRGKEDAGQAVLHSPALCPLPGAPGCCHGLSQATRGWLLTLLLAWASSRGSGRQHLELVTIGVLMEAGVSLGAAAPKVAPVARPRCRVLAHVSAMDGTYPSPGCPEMIPAASRDGVPSL